MTAGPTQSYGEQAPSVQWRARPVLATVVRAGATLGPVVVALALGAAAAHWLPAERLGLPGLAWLLLVVALSTAVLFGLSRWFRRLVPLSALLRLSLVVPDKVPSRFAVARRTWSPTTLPRESAGGAGDWLLTLVGTLAAHDDRTRAHGERVQAYAALIGREMGLPAQDVERLSWVALLHDVGKVHVPVEVINKNGRPTPQEWACLQQHPAHGDDLVEPLRGWLGDWLDGVVEHHERWDGRGYPAGLAGTGISLAARVIAVADTYDVITSARSYKRPLTAEQARVELTRCAGTQFDPDVVRALLGVGIGRLRFVAGPTTLLASLPGVGSAPAQAASGLSAAAQTAGGHLLGAVLTASLGVGSGALATGAVAAVLPAQVAQAAVEAADPVAGTPVDAPVDASPSALPVTVAPSAPATPTVAWTPLAGGVDPFRPLSARAGSGVGTVGAAGGAPTGSPATPATPSSVPTPPLTTAPTPPPTPPSTPPSTPAVPKPTPTSSTTSSTTTAPTASPTPSGGGGAPSPTTGPTTSPTSPTSPTGAPTTSPTTTGAPTPTGTGSPTSTSPTTTRPPTGPTTGPTTGPSVAPTTTSPTPGAGSDCARAVAGDRDLRGARLEGCPLTGRSLANRDLRGAKLTGAVMDGANLRGADLRGATLDGATLVGTDLTGADLRGASFLGAVLVLATLTGAHYDPGTFTGALGVAFA
ncbi:HD domain-containing phosphohydrolase [Kineococcus sp. NPDC059986]|uniref:HD domain-containing phosphohydrolase n=1 Tax=Kineococcus sp. NPDC059986 TaxID=3155538 RepID=UPI00344FEB76